MVTTIKVKLDTKFDTNCEVVKGKGREYPEALAVVKDRVQVGHVPALP